MNKESLTNLKQTLKRNKMFTTLDVIEQLEQSNWELLEKIEKMKNCGNCNGIRKGIRDERCKYCFKHKDLRYWELAE